MDSRVRKGILTALFLVAVALPATAFATTVRNNGVMAMSPARRALTARPPIRLTPTTISNTTPSTIKIRVFTALVRQQLDGTFTFDETPRALNEGRLVLSASPTSFTLKPNQTQKLDLHWQLMPAGRVAVYPGLIIEGRPQVKGQAVNTILRLLGVNFFKFPGAGPTRGRVVKVTGRQSAPRVLEFDPRIKNTGRVHASPIGGRCVITDGSGRVRFRAPFGQTNSVILPGFEREYPVTIKKPVLPAGRYRIRCAARFGKTSSSTSWRFTLSGPNTLPTADLKLRVVTAKGEIGSRASVAIKFANPGTKGSPTVLKVTLARLSATGRPPKPLAHARVSGGTLAAGATRTRTVDIGGNLTKGNYRATVVLSDGRTDVDELAGDFTASPKRSAWKRFTDWLGSYWWLLLLLLALLIIWILIARRRRRQRELEDGPARVAERSPELSGPAEAPSAPPPHTPAPPAAVTPPSPPAPARSETSPAPSALPPAPLAPSPGGRININSAGIDELVQLPGVGRRAAERIVAHREAHGPFGSLDDLHAVEGWHAERIRRIADSATV